MSNSEKIKEGLRRNKSWGGKIGNPNLDLVRNSDTTAANAARKKNADDFARKMREVIGGLYREGINTVASITKELNGRGITTRRGGKWKSMQVKRLIRRLYSLTSTL